MKKLLLLFATITLTVFSGSAEHPSLYVRDCDKETIINKTIESEWAREGLDRIKQSVDTFVNLHQIDPEWILSRMSMYWKDGERYTQCYLKDQKWNRGEGNAPVPTVRLPGMRTWNKYSNVPLADRIPYSESGDMLGMDRSHPEAAPVIVPYIQSGHMVRNNNGEILSLAENAAFLYWLEGDVKYAEFASDIFYSWLLGTYYMNPVLDPECSTNGPGGYEPGGICGYYDYEQIHDDLGMRGATIYDFMYDYLDSHPSAAMKATGKTLKDVAGTVFKRFIDIGMVRGGRVGNWNVNGWGVMIRPIMVLEENECYEDGKGRTHYLRYLTEESTPYHQAIPDILKAYDPVTGLWPESPGYAFGVVGSLLDFACLLRNNDIDIIGTNPMIQKAALAVIPWMDSRGNLPVFGDCRGGSVNFDTMEALLNYYVSCGDKDNIELISDVIHNGMEKGTYSRNADTWVKLCSYIPLDSEIHLTMNRERISYSPFHRLGIIKSAPDQADLTAILYGGRNGSHLTPNGLALQLYGNGFALAPDASGYESYWSDDVRYHQSAVGANTILPGYTEGEVAMTVSDPAIDKASFVEYQALTPWITAIEMKASEKRRLAAAITGDDGLGYYIDVFRSEQPENDYLFHNVGKSLELYASEDLSKIATDSLESLPLPEYQEGYRWFSGIRMADALDVRSIKGVWKIEGDGVDSMVVHFPYEDKREVFVMDAPYTTLYKELTPGGASAAPSATPTLLLRQKDARPIIAVFEPVMQDGENVKTVRSLVNTSDVSALEVECRNLRDMIVSTTDNSEVRVDGIRCDGNLNIVRLKDGKQPVMLYMLNGTDMEYGDLKIKADSPVSVSVYKQDGKWTYSSTGEAICRIGKDEYGLTRNFNKKL